MILVRRPWTWQPQNVLSGYFGPLSRGLVSVSIPGRASLLNLPVREKFTGTVNVKPKDFAYYGHGLVWSLEADNSNVEIGNGSDLTLALSTGSITVLAVMATTSTGRGDIVTRWTSGVASALLEQFNLLTGVSPSKPQFFVSSGSATVNSGASNIGISTNKTHVVVGSYSTGNCRIYVDGKLGSSNTAGSLAMTTGATQKLLIGNNNFNDGDLYGYVGLCAIWNRQLGDVEVAYISQNPWLLFAPRQIIIPTGAPAGIVTPTLTSATAINITTTSSRARVAFTRP